MPLFSGADFVLEELKLRKQVEKGSQRQSEANASLPEMRAHPRYTIALKLEYKTALRKKSEHSGSGRTINISSGGVLFHSTQALPLQTVIDLAISWPVSLDGCALKLVMRGRVVRTAGQATAVRVMQYEFRTAGTRRRLTATG